MLKSANNYSFKPSVVKACRNQAEELQKSNVAEMSGSLVQSGSVQGANTWYKGDSFPVEARSFLYMWDLELLPDDGLESDLPKPPLGPGNGQGGSKKDREWRAERKWHLPRPRTGVRSRQK